MNIITDQSSSVALSELKPLTPEYSRFEHIVQNRCGVKFSLKIMPRAILLRSCPMTHPLFPWNTDHQRFLEIRPVSSDHTISFKFLDPIYGRLLRNRNEAEKYIRQEIPNLDSEKVEMIISPVEVKLFFICHHCGLMKNESREIEIKHPENFLLNFSFINKLPCPNSRCGHFINTEIYTPDHIAKPRDTNEDCDWYRVY